MCRRRKLIFVTGLPGCGKTYHVHNDSELRMLPCVDIKDIYLSCPEASQYDGWKLAQDKMVESALQLMKHRKTDVICEAILYKGTPSRQRLEEYLKAHRIRHAFVDIEADYSECFKRVYWDYQNVASRTNNWSKEADIYIYYQKRLDILRSYRMKGIV